MAFVRTTVSMPPEVYGKVKQRFRRINDIFVEFFELEDKYQRLLRSYDALTGTISAIQHELRKTLDNVNDIIRNLTLTAKKVSESSEKSAEIVKKLERSYEFLEDQISRLYSESQSVLKNYKLFVNSIITPFLNKVYGDNLEEKDRQRQRIHVIIEKAKADYEIGELAEEVIAMIKKAVEISIYEKQIEDTT